MLATALVAVSLFVATNIDSLVVTTALVVTERARGDVRVWRIWVGQCLGLAVVVLAAMGISAGFDVISMRYLAVIGVVPIALGCNGLRRALWSDDGGGPMRGGSVGIIGATTVTLANGADNVAAYVPVLRGYTESQLMVTAGVFGVLAILWWATSLFCASHKGMAALLVKAGRWIVPALFIVVGANAVYRGLRAN